MENDKAFTLYAAVLITGALTVVGALVLSGVAKLPTPLVFAEHVGLALLVRAMYKSLDGSRWSVFDLWADLRDREPAEKAPAGDTADALG